MKYKKVIIDGKEYYEAVDSSENIEEEDIMVEELTNIDDTVEKYLS